MLTPSKNKNDHELSRRRFLGAIGARLSLAAICASLSLAAICASLSLAAICASLSLAAVGCGDRSPEEKASESTPDDVSEEYNVFFGCPTQTSMILSVIAPDDREWAVRWGEDIEHLWGRKTGQQAREGIPVEIKLEGLAPGNRYCYQIVAVAEEEESGSQEGTFHTQPKSAEPFVFTITADSHLLVGHPRKETDPSSRTLLRVAGENPDFHVTLGDDAVTHSARFIAPDLNFAQLCYRNFRDHFQPVARKAPFFCAIGNHEGEGWIDESFGLNKHLAEISRTARQRYVPNPDADTYPQGGSPDQNYFAWSWGDALFIVVDPHSYSSTRPLEPESWTLGTEQLAWLEKVLTTSNHKWKILFQHHLVGGSPLPAAMYGNENPYNNYGRGGAAFAHVGEQAVINRLMKQKGGKIIFKGHDHVFADEVHDGVRYTTCPRLFGDGKRPPKWSRIPGGEKLYPNGYDVAVGYVRVEVAPGSLEVKCIASDGRIMGGYSL